MYYYGYFRNNDTSKDKNGQLYKVIIITNFRENETTVGGELVLTDSPFTVEYSSEENQLQKPYKCSTATVGILQEDINYSFFDSSGNNVLVQLLKWRNDNIYIDGFGWVGTKNQSVIIPDYDSANADTYLFDVEWSGFATPNAYSQNYEAINDEFELECQDALSTLKYKNYEKLGDFCSFSDILKKYVLELGVYKNIYITDSVKIATTDVQDVLHATFVDERNFFDEDGEPMKVMEVLEETMKFYSLTIIPFRDNLYVVNYDGIKNRNNDYFCISYPSINNYFKNGVITNFTTKEGKVTLSDNKEILANDFAENGTSVSIESTFNKVKVTNDSYPIDTLLLDLDERVIRRSDTPLQEDIIGHYLYNRLAYIYFGSKYLNIIEDYRENNNYKKLYIRYNDFPLPEIGADKYIEPYWYEKDDDDGYLNYEDIKDTLIRHDGKTDITPYICKDNIGTFIGEYCTTSLGDMVYDRIGDINLSSSIFMCQPTANDVGDDTRSGWSTTEYMPYLNGGQVMLKTVYYGVQSSRDTYINIKGALKFYNNPENLPIEHDYNSNAKSDYCFIWARLIVGHYALESYFNTLTDNGFRWVDLNTVHRLIRFKLPLEYDNEKNCFTSDFKFCNESIFRNQHSWDEIKALQLGEGLSVPMPTDEIGEIKSNIYNIEFSLYRPFVPSEARHYARLTELKNFDISIVKRKSVEQVGIDDDNDDNIEYTNVANEISVDDYEDVDLKYSSWCKQPLNYNSLLFSNTFYEQGYLHQSSTKNRLTTIYNKGMGTLIRPEETIITTVINQYKTPTTAIELNLKESNDYMPYSTLNYHFFDGKTFVVDGMGINYRYNTNTLRIVEKK